LRTCRGNGPSRGLLVSEEDRTRDSHAPRLGSTRPTAGPRSSPEPCPWSLAESRTDAAPTASNPAGARGTVQQRSCAHGRMQFHRSDHHARSTLDDAEAGLAEAVADPPAVPRLSPLGMRSAKGIGQRFAAPFGPTLNGQDGAARAEDAVWPSSSCCDVRSRPPIWAMPGDHVRRDLRLYLRG